jgi:hypothetical protein
MQIKERKGGGGRCKDKFHKVQVRVAASGDFPRKRERERERRGSGIEKGRLAM